MQNSCVLLCPFYCIFVYSFMPNTKKTGNERLFKHFKPLFQRFELFLSRSFYGDAERHLSD